MVVGIKTAATVTAAFFMAIGPILVTLSKVPDPERNVTEDPEERYIFEYSVPVSTMVTEFFKLVMSSVLLLSTRMRASDEANAAQPLLHSESGMEFLRFMVPAFIYFMNNNLVFFILLAVDPITFQLLSQIKTIFTGLLFRLFLGRRLSAVQYTALITLACGTATAQVPSGGQSVRPSAWWGLLLSVVSALLSSLGGIYSEKLLKVRLRPPHARICRRLVAASPRAPSCLEPRPPSVDRVAGAQGEPALAERAALCVGRPLQCHWRLHEGRRRPARPRPPRRLQRLGVGRRAVQRARGAPPWHAPPLSLPFPRSRCMRQTQGHGSWLSAATCRHLSCAPLSATSAQGLAISAVLKFADNIARVYAHAVAMIATMLLSVELFGSAVTPQLLLGMTLVANSTFQCVTPTTLSGPHAATHARSPHVCTLPHVCMHAHRRTRARLAAGTTQK